MVSLSPQLLGVVRVLVLPAWARPGSGQCSAQSLSRWRASEFVLLFNLARSLKTRVDAHLFWTGKQLTSGALKSFRPTPVVLGEGDGWFTPIDPKQCPHLRMVAPQARSGV